VNPTCRPTSRPRADELRRSGIPNADLLAGISADSFEASGLDSDTVVLIWLAALVALGAPSEAYLMNLGPARPRRVSVRRCGLHADVPGRGRADRARRAGRSAEDIWDFWSPGFRTRLQDAGVPKEWARRVTNLGSNSLINDLKKLE
jgi:hypothetical protein